GSLGLSRFRIAYTCKFLRSTEDITSIPRPLQGSYDPIKRPQALQDGPFLRPPTTDQEGMASPLLQLRDVNLAAITPAGGFKMRIPIITDGQVTPYLREPGLSDQILLPPEVDTVNLTWQSGHER
ncbi:hypothetical protein BaRGS_00005419, partial [Batillaria attramentaria]